MLKGIAKADGFCSDACRTHGAILKAQAILKDEKGKDTLDNLKKLVDALEAGGYPATPEPAMLIVKPLLERYPELFSDRVKAFFADPTKAVKQTIYPFFTGVPGVAPKIYPCEYFSAVVPCSREKEGVKRLAWVLDQLLGEDLLLGYLASPSALDFAHPDNIWKDLEPPKSMLKLPAINEAVFCFFFSKLTHEELKERFPEWARLEGEVGDVMLDLPAEPEKMESVKIEDLTASIFSPKDGDVIIIQSEGGIDEAVIHRVRQQLMKVHPEIKRVAVLGIDAADKVIVVRGGEVIST
jgi:hypothetical protein